MLDPKAKQQIDKGFNTLFKVWGRVLKVALYIVATVVVCRAFEQGWLIAWAPGVARASYMDLALVSATVVAAIFGSRQ